MNPSQVLLTPYLPVKDGSMKVILLVAGSIAVAGTRKWGRKLDLNWSSQ